MIPRVIHIININGSNNLDSASIYSESIREKCNNFKIKVWNERSFPSKVKDNNYYKAAMKIKNYAFASDIARVYILKNCGGIYLDTDVELLKSIDFLCNYSFVMGFESKYTLSTSFIACEPNHKILREIWEKYYDNGVINNFQNFFKIPNVEYFSIEAFNYGFRLNGENQLINDSCLFKQEYFSPLYFYNEELKIVSNNTISVHHFNASWKNNRKNSFKIGTIKLLTSIFGDQIFLYLRLIHRRTRHY